MPATKAVAAALVVLIAAGGAVASTGAAPLPADANGDAPAERVPADVDVHAALDNGTVTVTVADGEAPLSNVTVEVEGDEVERTVTTDANGTVAVDLGADAENLELELTDDGFEGELEYLVTDDGLRLVEEEYEYEVADEDDEADEDADDADEDADDEEAEEYDDVEDDADDDEDEAEDEEEEEEESEDDDGDADEDDE